MDHQNVLVPANSRDRSEVLDGVVGKGVQAWVGRMDAGRQHDRVAVGRGSNQRFGADDRVAAGAVLHDYLLAPAFGQLLTEKTGHYRGAASGSIGGDEADRLVGISLLGGGGTGN